MGQRFGKGDIHLQVYSEVELLPELVAGPTAASSGLLQ